MSRASFGFGNRYPRAMSEFSRKGGTALPPGMPNLKHRWLVEKSDAMRCNFESRLHRHSATGDLRKGSSHNT